MVAGDCYCSHFVEMADFYSLDGYCLEVNQK